MTAEDLFFWLKSGLNSGEIRPSDEVILSIPDPRGSDRIAQCPVAHISHGGRCVVVFGDYNEMDFE